MSLLRIYCSLNDAAQTCSWALIDTGREAVLGEGKLADLPRRAERIQLLIPATQVLITRVRLPPAARRRGGSVLAFAVEEETLGEADAKQVIWLGSKTGEGDDTAMLAVIDRKGLQTWLSACDAAGIRNLELHCETLLLPRSAGEWSLAWDGREGFLRSADLEGAACDCGDRSSPPLSLMLMLEEAARRGDVPAAIAIYLTAPDAAPDLAAWQAALGLPLRLAGFWDWRKASADAGIEMKQERRPWRVPPAVLARLRPAAWMVGLALAVHAAALMTDWAQLAGQQRALRQRMESRFRAAFPEAVAVVDPALQMRRKLAEGRHAAGLPDSGDFLPMIEQVALALKELPPGMLHIVSYESGRMTLELGALEQAARQRMLTRLAASGLSVEDAQASGNAIPGAASRAAGGIVRFTVRAL